MIIIIFIVIILLLLLLLLLIIFLIKSIYFLGIQMKLKKFVLKCVEIQNFLLNIQINIRISIKILKSTIQIGNNL